MPLKARLCLGITGHRNDNPEFAAERERIGTTLSRVFDLIDAALAEEARVPGIEIAPTRLHSLLADGADQMAAEDALARHWELVAPLPFGLALTTAMNAQPADGAEANVLLHGSLDQWHTLHAATRERASRLRELAPRAHLFELADQDDSIANLLLAKLADAADKRKAQVLDAEVSLRVAMASRVMIEQSDFLIAVWDGTTRALVGGTGHTIQAALETGTSVLWIDALAQE